MDLLHYPTQYTSFGNSLFDTTCKHVSYSMLEYPAIIQATNDTLNLQFNLTNSTTEGLFLYKKDISLSRNLANNKAYQLAKSEMEATLKKYLLVYYNHLNNNTLAGVR